MKIFESLRSISAAIVDAVLPPKERTIRAGALSIERVPLTLTSHTLLGVTITTLMDYKRQEVQDLVQSLKYDGGFSGFGGTAAELCASVLAEYLIEQLSEEKLFSHARVFLIPVPLHKSRSRERGFNQIELVLKRMPKAFLDGTTAQLLPEALERTRATKPQARLHRSERLSNVAGAFALADGADVRGARVYLIDDVATTGATLANAAQPLRRAGAHVTLLALARA